MKKRNIIILAILALYSSAAFGLKIPCGMGIKKQFLDSNADGLSGGLLHTYEAGTTTNLTTYTDENGGTPNANPIVLDSSGIPTGIYCDADDYKFVLTNSAASAVWTHDNVKIRDFGAEIDVINASITVIDNTITVGTVANRLASGAASSNSSAPRFLVPIGSSNQVKILATTTDLVYYIDSTEFTVAADATASGLSSPPTSNNTALVNNSAYADDNYTKQLGEFGTAIPIDTVGSEITSLNGSFAAFKIAGVTTGYFFARVDTTNNILTEAKRGYFYDASAAAIPRTAFSNNDTITLMKMTWLYLKSNGTMLATYTEPTYSSTAPSSPANGDMYFDYDVAKWYRFNSTVWEDSESVFLGVCITDESGNTVGARPAEFHADVVDTNTFKVEFKGNTQIQSKNTNNAINVGGVKLIYKNSKSLWDMTADLESGQSETASTEYYAYVKENSDLVISETAPYDRTGDLKGWYHSYEMWRFVGRVNNNSSSNLDLNSVTDSPEQPRAPPIFMKVGDFKNIGIVNATTTNANDSIKITSADHTPLSESNPAYIALAHASTAGKVEIFKIVADITLNITGASWGLTTDQTDYPIEIYGINNNGSFTIGVGAVPGLKLILDADDSATGTDINLVDEHLVKSALGADGQSVTIGWVKANLDYTGGAAEILWAVQSGDNDIRISESSEGVMRPFLPTVNAAAFGTITTNVGMWTKNKNLYIAEGSWINGTTTGTTAELDIQSGLVIDAAKVSGTGNQNIMGHTLRTNGTDAYWTSATPHILFADESDNTALFFTSVGASDGNMAKAVGTTVGDANSGPSFTIYGLPITGWD